MRIKYLIPGHRVLPTSRVLAKRIPFFPHPSAVILQCVSPETRGKSKDTASISFPLNQAHVGHLLRAPLPPLPLLRVLWISPPFFPISIKWKTWQQLATGS
ncbi:uncharacterized protein LOC122616230 isoform X1 [Drosophila teissieri]|uniref:uncharacterized protein LOC122616230 isoform X1 n=1 Tax=Drosophila teissieri TaxID=7243 RepID=UPI001CB9E39B|nr:uncharacterized protein LOC122616230 isoform X1 [Drosophila teissieri]